MPRSPFPARRPPRRVVKDAFHATLGAVPLLTAGEEVELARRRDAGDGEALDRLIVANLRWAVRVATRHRHVHGGDQDDLEQAAIGGLMRAARKFDPDRGVRFSTYATWWIRQALARHAGEARLIHVPENPQARASEEAARARAIASIDEPNEHGSTPSELLADRGEAPEEAMRREEAAGVLAAAVRRLGPRDAEVLRRRYGLQGGEPETLKEVGDRLGLTRERVRQIEKRARERLARLLAPAVAN